MHDVPMYDGGSVLDVDGEECRRDERKFTSVKPPLKYKFAGAKLFTSMDIFDERERATKRLFTGAKPVTTSSDFTGAMNRDGKSNLRAFTGAGVITPVS
jgi:hypothetical protein